MNIEITLNKGFETKLEELRAKYGEDMFEIEGLGKKQLNTTLFFDKFMNSNNVANASIDDNSNVSDKNMTIMLSESRKPLNKLLSRNKLYIEMKENFGKQVADEWLELQINGALYEHDAHDSSLKPYCYAYSLKPVVDKGLYFIKDMKAKPAEHLDTYDSHVLEFIAYATNLQSGAVGIPDYLIYAFYFWKKDIENGVVTKEKANRYREQHWQKMLFSLNQPYLKGGEQSAYTNFSILDREHILGFFGMEKFPDNTLIIDYIDEIIQYQKDFLDYEKKLRYEKFFTFPVISASLLYKNDKFVDEDMARFINKHNMTWQDVNIYRASSIDALASCCFDGQQKTLTKSSHGVNYLSFKDLYDTKYKDKERRNFKIFHNGNWVEGKPIRLLRNDKKMYKITAVNNKEILVTEDHINVTDKGDKYTTQLTENDYIAFNTRPTNAIPEKDEKLTYEQGVLIGAYLGDGSKQRNEHKIQLSINEEKYNILRPLIEKALKQWNIQAQYKLYTPHNNAYPTAIISEDLLNTVEHWVKGDYSYNKRLNLEILHQSIEFRKGVLDGMYFTDGGNSNRIYTTSDSLKEDLEILINSLGMVSIINTTDRTDEKVIIRGEEFNRNYPLHCIRFYQPTHKRNQKDIYKVINNTMFFKIKTIQQYISNDEYVYCFEMKNIEEPYFTLPNGVITHNCRLTSSSKEISENKEVAELNGHFNSIGGSSLSIGSCKVNTINMVRIALECNGDFNKFKDILKHRVDISHKYLKVQRDVIAKNIKKNLLPLYSHGLMDMNNQFSTIGINGMFEAIKILGGIETTSTGVHYTNRGLSMAKDILETIGEMNKVTRKQYGYNANIEQIPAESASVKLCKKDKILFGDRVNTYIYGNQWIPLNVQADLTERVRVASVLDKACGGGVMLHINLGERFKDEEQSWRMMNYLAKQGVVYFSFIMKINVCENDHSFYGDMCPICHKPVSDSYIKIVGYLVKQSSYKSERAKEMDERKFYSNYNI